MTPSFREILETLNLHQVEYIVVGGVAAVIHGAPTTTFDLDALVRLNRTNAERLTRALSELEARFREHQKPVYPTVEHILAGGHLLLMTRAGPLDILIRVVSQYANVSGSGVGPKRENPLQFDAVARPSADSPA